MTPSSNSVWGDHKSTLDGCSGPSPCQRSSSPPPAAYAPAREKRETKSSTDWQLQYPCTFGDLSAGRAPACRNPVAGCPPLSERLHLIVLLPIPPPPPPDSVGDRHHGLVNQPIQCGGNRGVCWTDAQAPCQDRREAAELWNPVAAHLLCLGAVCAVCAPRLHFCTSAFHLLCPSSPSGSYHPRCHLPQLCLLGSICAVTMVKSKKVNNKKQKKNKKTQPVSRKMSLFPHLLLSISAFCM